MKRISHELLCDDLRNICGAENTIDRKTDLTAHSLNRNWYTRTLWSRNEQIPIADVIVYPESTEQISEVLKLANREKIPVTPYGSGSSGMGGNIPERGGIILDMKRMNKLEDINQKSLMATVQAGMGSWAYEDELNKRGYTSGHVPASNFCATIGGFLALRSAGRLSTGYGKIEDMAMALEVVLPGGQIMRTRPVPAHATGPELNQLFIGSEGTFGIITKAVLKIHPYPEERRFRAFVFPTLHAGIEAMRKILRTGTRVIAARLYDERETATLFRKTWGVEKEGAYLVVGFDGMKDRVAMEENVCLTICSKEGGEDLGNERGEYWWEHRYHDYYPANIDDVERYQRLLGAGQAAGATMDVCAPYDKIETLYEELKEVFMQKYSEKYSADLYGHFSHWYKFGTMVYSRWHVQDIPDGENIVALYNDVWSTLIPVAIKHGAVIEHHHGVGRVLGRFLKMQDEGSFEVLRNVKKALDPNNIMNPGVLGLGDY
jgi:alkyldihydroxyacetonephosphate synthase